MTLPELRWRASPNWNERRTTSGQPAIRHVILHYTGMPDGAGAEDRLCDADAQVSAHYLVHEDGRVVQMVEEAHRAWHAGVSQWQGEGDLNSSSIGIEIVNPGHEWGYRSFPQVQIDAVKALLAAIVERHAILPQHVLGHSDIAPGRKEDPGEFFPWHQLAKAGLALAEPEGEGADPGWSDAQFAAALQQFGYDVTDLTAATTAFQRHFRQSLVDGRIDARTRAVLHSLLQL